MATFNNGLLNKRVKFSDGQGLDFNDMLKVQDFEKVVAWDLLTSSIRSSTNSNFEGTDQYPYVVNSNHAYPFVDSGTPALTVDHTAGLLMQRSVAFDGLTPKTQMYLTTQSEAVQTFAPGNFGVHRIDGVFIKISETNFIETRDFEDATTRLKTSSSTTTRNQTSLDVVKVVGTDVVFFPPVIPTAPAGYVPWYYVYLSPAFAGVFGTTQVYDNRMPVGKIHEVFINPLNGIFSPGAWSGPALGDSFGLVSGGALSTAAFVLPSSSPLNRILSIRIDGTLTADRGLACFNPSTSALPTTDNPFSAFAATPLVNGFYVSYDGTAGGNMPVWGNGLGSGAYPYILAPTPIDRILAILLESGAAGEHIRSIRVQYVAG